MCNAYALNIPPDALADAFLQKVIAWYWPDPMPSFGPADEVRPT
jgi:hypothetical protein